MATTEETALATRTEATGELAPTAASAAAQHEIQSAIIIARRFPRNEDDALQKLVRACGRAAFAENVSYSFPRGKRQDENGRWVKNIVTGPSVYLAREAARIWGNIRFGVDIVNDDDESRTVRAWAWDMETNTRVSYDDQFKKLIQRKDRDSGETRWVAPDERDLREHTNRRAAIAVRNCLLQLFPQHMIDAAQEQAANALTAHAKDNPEEARRNIVIAFGQISVTVEELETYLGVRLSKASPKQIAELRQIWKSIKDGQSSWGDYKPAKEREQGTLSADDLKPGAEPNRGHDKEGLAKVAPKKDDAPKPDKPPAATEKQVMCGGDCGQFFPASKLSGGLCYDCAEKATAEGGEK